MAQAACSGFFLQRSGTVTNITATEQSILEISSGTRQSQRQQQSFQSSLYQSSFQGLWHRSPLSPPPPSQQAKDCEVERRRRVRLHSKTTYTQALRHAQARQCIVMQSSNRGVPLQLSVLLLPAVQLPPGQPVWQLLVSANRSPGDSYWQ